MRLRAYLLATCVLLALAALIYPVYVIRPFRPQGPAELDAALLILRIRPFLFAATFAIAALNWRRQFTHTAALLLIIAAAGLSRVNIFERMFHPIDAPAFQPVTEAQLDPAEKLLTVQSRAYPIRALAYHHIVNDAVDGIPLVGTY